MSIEEIIAAMSAMADMATAGEEQWDYAIAMWALEREQQVRYAVYKLHETMFSLDPTVGLLALYIVVNKIKQATDREDLATFGAALRRLADKMVEVP